VDEGLPIAYTVLGAGVPVVASGGEQVGTVDHVVAAEEQDIFHGLVIAVPSDGQRFVEAADVASLHEHGVDLAIDAAAIAALPRPGGGAPSYRQDPTETRWEHLARRWTGRKDWHRDG
jgi:hypothetical protein